MLIVLLFNTQVHEELSVHLQVSVFQKQIPGGL